MAKPKPPLRRWQRLSKMRHCVPPFYNRHWCKRFTIGLHGWAGNRPSHLMKFPNKPSPCRTVEPACLGGHKSTIEQCHPVTVSETHQVCKNKTLHPLHGAICDDHHHLFASVRHRSCFVGCLASGKIVTGSCCVGSSSCMPCFPGVNLGRTRPLDAGLRSRLGACAVC